MRTEVIEAIENAQNLKRRTSIDHKDLQLMNQYQQGHLFFLKLKKS
jgi:hypothetical protein